VFVRFNPAEAGCSRAEAVLAILPIVRRHTSPASAARDLPRGTATLPRPQALHGSPAHCLQCSADARASSGLATRCAATGQPQTRCCHMPCSRRERTARPPCASRSARCANHHVRHVDGWLCRGHGLPQKWHPRRHCCTTWALACISGNARRGAMHACTVAKRRTHGCPGLATTSALRGRDGGGGTALGATAAATKFEPQADGLDFYSVMGVSPNADTAAIRAAYKRLMMDLHPDKAAVKGTADLCALVNEIYTVLSNQDQRDAYDALAGFSTSSVNPFVDNEFPRDQVFVDEVTCIGCGKCVRQAPGTFEIEESKYGRARVINQDGDTQDNQEVAIEVCPVDCIHWVTLPQLSLLEAALASMGRVEVKPWRWLTLVKRVPAAGNQCVAGVA